jgi:hypothetical protein
MRWLQRWSDLALRNKCLLLISFPIAATVLMAAVSYLVGTGTTDAGLGLNASLRIGKAIERLSSSEIEMNAQARAYLITADESFAGKTQEAMAAFDSAWRNLSDLTACAWPKSRRWNARAWSAPSKKRLASGRTLCDGTSWPGL